MHEMPQEKLSFTSASRIALLVHQLPNGKSAGHDGLAAEHAKFASPSLCINAIMIHGRVPLNLTKDIPVPIVKNTPGDVTSTSNYRPIAL